MGTGGGSLFASRTEQKTRPATIARLPTTPRPSSSTRKSVVGYRYRAYLYDELGRGGAARDDCNGILELDPDNKDAAKALKRMGPDIRQMKVQ